MSIDVVIVNWNSGKLLFDCIESIIEHGKPHVSKVFIVDNGSSDDSEKFLQAHYLVVSLYFPAFRMHRY